MQTLFARYVFRQVATALLLILLALTAVLWIALALKSLNVVTSQGQTTVTFLKITFLALPNLVTIIAPVALMIASVQTLNRVNGDSELIVMTASGATVWFIARPFLVMAVIVSVLVALGSMIVNPWSARSLQLQIAKVRTDLISQVLKPGEFSTPEKGLAFHIRERDRNGVINGLLIRDTREKATSLTYLAERAQIVKQDGKPYLVMYAGHIVRKEPDKAAPQVIGFATYAFDIEQMAPQNKPVYIKPRARYMAELFSPDPKEPYFVRWPGRYRAELHERLSSVLYPFVFVLIVLSQLGHAQTTRQGRIQQITTAVVLTVAVRLGGLAATNLTVKQAWATPLLYLLPLGAIVWAIYLTHTKMQPRKISVLEQRWQSWLENTGDKIMTLFGRMTSGRKSSQPQIPVPPS